MAEQAQVIDASIQQVKNADLEKGQNAPAETTKLKKAISAPAPEAPLGKYEYPSRPLPAYAISKSCPAPPCYKKKIGRFYVFAEDKAGRPICM